jgi:hypothetical protein
MSDQPEVFNKGVLLNGHIFLDIFFVCWLKAHNFSPPSSGECIRPTTLGPLDKARSWNRD